jgi:hypothetical protein
VYRCAGDDRAYRHAGTPLSPEVENQRAADSRESTEAAYDTLSRLAVKEIAPLGHRERHSPQRTHSLWFMVGQVAPGSIAP